jgi:hypothetical protein
MTFLYHQLDPNIKPEVREKMAAALVGESVSVVAKPPQKKQPASQPPNAETPPIPVDPESELGKMAGQNRRGILAVSPISQEEFTKLWNLGLRIRRFVILGLMIVIGLLVVMAVSHFIQSHWKRSAVASAAMPVSKQAAAANPTPTTPAVVEPQNQSQQTTRTVAPATVVKSVASPVNPTAVAQPVLDKQGSQERDIILEQIKNLVADEAEKVSNFKSHCETFWDIATNKVEEAPSRYRSSLREKLGSIHDTAVVDIQTDEHFLNYVPTQYSVIGTTPQTDGQKTLERLKTIFSKKEADRQVINNALKDWDAELTAAKQKRGLLYFK